MKFTTNIITNIEIKFPTYTATTPRKVIYLTNQLEIGAVKTMRVSTKIAILPKNIL